MMEAEPQITEDEVFDYDSFDEQNYERPTERWAPLGAASSSPQPMASETSHLNAAEQLQQLEEEQDQLNSSLLALTTHFAQVQFRLKQIVSAQPDDKEVLLKELEEFAFKGIPDVRGSKIQDAQLMEEMSEQEHEIKISEQREKQRELIQQLKSQLEDLETYAYETGDEEIPTNKLMEKQKVVIDRLKQKLDLDLENFNRLSTEELRQVVDHAIGQIVNPSKVKEKLVQQLQTQITDLERFIDFLQGESSSPGPLGKERCTCPVHKSKFQFGGDDSGSDIVKECCIPGAPSKASIKSAQDSQKSVNRSAHKIVKKAIAVLQIFVISQFGCGSKEFERNLLKKTTKANHWGDLRAKLQVSIDRVLQVGREQEEQNPSEDDFDSENSEEESVKQSSQALTQVVRKDLAIAIKDLMEHGLMEIGQSRSLVPFGCFPARSANAVKQLHAWDLFIKYYELKHGREYNESPARKLSQSFHLDIVGGKPITAKQTLLGAIDTVMNLHNPMKKNEDSQLKAFICLALNEKKLSTWLKLIFKSQSLIDSYYQDWSYVARTGYDDALKALDKLNIINFKLPVDLAVRHFTNIKDAF